MTRPVDAYREGKAARAARPAATTWEGLLPYAGYPLAAAWLDGWTGRYDRLVAGWCPFCWSPAGLTDLPDGTPRCRQHPCRERNWPPVDRAKVPAFLAARDAGAYI